ncbi:MAG: DegT/DnrJ/EryC1/StrS family aminotransferase [Candidatus Omnitrophica bacterium]|nr:DegT/DnrJ/EryC1/StrS family aminotransferase [Candidatus Omnitrophota bacterium]MBU1997384.1 DegT/DnrJ/EryC1/StrS family aminotransferase [Candidatus Omnitrophota bacterium]
MTIPFVDLKTQYQTLKPEIDKAIQDVIDQTAFIGGKYPDAFEKAYAEKYGVKHCISVGNGTDAIYIALKALGIGPGDEVITTSISWIATSEAVTQTGAKVVFVDVDLDYLSIDTSLIEEKITDRTKAILPVHLYGQPARMDKIRELCDKYNLYLLEDCAQSHFAEFKGKKVGTFGDIGTFSFYPGKNLGAYGDAGAVITNNDELAKFMRMFARHGSLVKHQHEIEGINSRMDAMQAAILSVKLPHILDWNKKRFENACLYNKYLHEISEISLPKIMDDVKHIFHLYVIKTDRRDELQKFLNEKDIQNGVHYPIGLPFLKAYDYLGHKQEDFPNAFSEPKRILSLPMSPDLTEDQIIYVSNAIKEFFGR